MRDWWPGYTSEVRHTDRVLRFPRLFTWPAMLGKTFPDVYYFDNKFLLSTLTGEPSEGLFFPIMAVRWLTLPRDIAALVADTGHERFEAELFHFGESSRPMGAELYLLKPGRHTFSLINQGTGEVLSSQSVTLNGQRVRVRFELPPRTLCAVRVRQRL